MHNSVVFNDIYDNLRRNAILQNSPLFVGGAKKCSQAIDLRTHTYLRSCVIRQLPW